MKEQGKQGRAYVEIPDDVHARLKMLAPAEGMSFYEWIKDVLVGTCPDERTLIEMLRDIRKESSNEANERL